MKLRVREIVIFGMLAALMFASKLIMEALPNIHLLGMLTIAITIVYRWKALFPIYTYVILNGFIAGFAPWWVPYLYVWTVLWGATMLLPKRLPKKLRPFLYAALCSAHGFAFGILYAPVQALMFGMSFQSMLAWIAAGFPFDCIHGISNLFTGMLIVPIVKAIQLAERTSH